MDITEVEGTDITEEHDHPTNYRLREEGMNVVEEHYHLMNHRPREEGMDMVGIHMVELGYEYGGGAPVEPQTGGGGY
jgi:hypothetical protein